MKRRRRRNRTPEEVRRIVEEFRASGLSQTAFARRIDVRGSVLSRWVKRQRPEKGSTPPSVAPSFVSVEITPRAASDASQLEVVLSGGRVVRVHYGFNEETLGRLVSVLEQC